MPPAEAVFEMYHNGAIVPDVPLVDAPSCVGEPTGEQPALLMHSNSEHDADYDEGLEFKPKIYINGFPKSGLHLAMLMVMALTEKPAHEVPWAGSFAYNGWSNEWLPDWRLYQRVARLQEGTWLKGHMGYRVDMAEFLDHLGVQMAFIYRDLRDVAVSMSFHVLADDDKKYTHPDKAIYRALKTQEDVLLACITGIDASKRLPLNRFPSLVDRWEQYAGWLDVPWVHRLPYENMRLEPFMTARLFVNYIYARMVEVNGVTVDFDQGALTVQACRMAMAMERRQTSPTYRRGLPGGWREYWTERVDKAFVDTGAAEWNHRLGYQ